MTRSTLFVVATPIGNLDDLSPRATKVLGDVDVIAAEDTRRTGRLLQHAGVSTRQVSLHEHNEDTMVRRLLDDLARGRSVALVSDAGTPLISDPGYRLVRAARDAGYEVSPVPGPSAAIAALSVCGLPADRFCFEGFLPSNRSARSKRLGELAIERRTIVLYESVHRIGRTLDELVEACGESRSAFVGRELSKLHEQCVSTTLGELREMTGDGRIPAKGEFVVAVEGWRGTDESTSKVDVHDLLREFAALLPGSRAVEVVSSLTGRGRNELYRLMLSLPGAGEDE